MSSPLPLQNRWWIDPVRVRMGILLGLYMSQGVCVCLCVSSDVHSTWANMYACGSVGALNEQFGWLIGF